MLQLERQHHGNIAVYTAKKIIEKSFEEFTKKHYEKIKSKFEIGDDDLKEAIDEIVRLNPKIQTKLFLAIKFRSFNLILIHKKSHLRWQMAPFLLFIKAY